jgi:hypothetical protein
VHAFLPDLIHAVELVCSLGNLESEVGHGAFEASLSEAQWGSCCVSWCFRYGEGSVQARV